MRVRLYIRKKGLVSYPDPTHKRVGSGYEPISKAGKLLSNYAWSKLLMRALYSTGGACLLILYVGGGNGAQGRRIE